MKKSAVAIAIAMVAAACTGAAELRVPTRTYPTIQRAIDGAIDGDVVILAPNPGPPYSADGTYSGAGNVDLDFKGKAITVTSDIDPDNPNWDIINATVIDCKDKFCPEELDAYCAHHRGFVFRNGEGAGSRLIGVTIINGWISGPIGAIGTVPGEPTACGSEPCPPQANGGESVMGDGYGGGVLCDGASPSISLCVIRNCTVTGAQGGAGEVGLDGTWEFLDPDCEGTPEECAVEVDDGQWGGKAGDGTGNGRGGGIACINAGSPIIDRCIITGNSARGGVGGKGGKGGSGSSDSDKQGLGGKGGNGIGDGFGGGIYAEDGSDPVVIDSTISLNIASEGLAGLGGDGGDVGEPPQDEDGNDLDPKGEDGSSANNGLMAGGGAYHSTDSDSRFAGCEFTGNSAKVATTFFGTEFAQYFDGGGLYSIQGNTVTLGGCLFKDNTGSAVYCGNSSTVTVSDSLFQGNDNTPLGGAIFVGRNGSLEMDASTFTGNTADTDGGAVECQGNLTMTGCSFNKNISSGFGGAVDVYGMGTQITVNATGCVFKENQGLWGGGLFTELFEGTVADCYLINNSARAGGGMYLTYGDAAITGGRFSENSSSGDSGGGLKLVVTDLDMRDCLFDGNSSAGSGGSGGAISFDGPASQTVSNCLITNNTADENGGAFNCSGASPEIASCTFNRNMADGNGAAVYLAYNSRHATLTDCIISNSERSAAVHEDDGGGDVALDFCLFADNFSGDFHDAGTGSTVSGAAAINAIPRASDNIAGNPRYIPGPLGDFYLNQATSPAVNAGSDTAANAGLDTYTTDPAESPDSGILDIGYHHPLTAGLTQYSLVVTVTAGQGTVQPTSGTFFAGSIVTLTAKPATAWRVKQWTGTNNDASVSTTNSVIMNSDRNVTVEFEQPQVLTVSVDGGFGQHYPSIHAANHDARDGDTIVIYPGIYQGPPVHVNKSVTVRSLNPDDPAVVAATIIEGGEEYAGPRLYLEPGDNNDAKAVINGLTFRNNHWFVIPAEDGDRGIGHPDGFDGGGATGGIIRIMQNAGPTIKNCVIRDNSVKGGDAGDGENATSDENAGRGGWGGWARGGAVYCGIGSTPSFINCQIVDNLATGGNGGDGGDGNGGSANYGGNWSRPGWYNIHSDSLVIEFVEDHLWSVWQTSVILEGNETTFQLPGYIGDYRYYSAYGGGVFCDANSVVTLTDCTISGNRTLGGMSGIGGERPGIRQYPVISYEIPSFGGGVYCAGNSTVTFDGCTLTDNIASEPALEDPNDSESGLRYRVDPYLGHGGGVCAEDTAKVKFVDCTFSDNKAAVGGGVNFANANVEIADCDFIANRAFQGGGIFGNNDSGSISGCNFLRNQAVSDIFDVNDPNLAMEPTLGRGGGLCLSRTSVGIADCVLTTNHAESSGGGVFIVGEGSPKVNNCLVVGNTAGRDGGGVSANLFALLNISNTTIADNVTTGTGFVETLGGGLYCSYEAVTDVINSIIWGNSANRGAQIAVGTGFDYDKMPAEVRVSYSDVEDGGAGVFVDTGCTLVWDDPTNLDGTVLTDPNFATGDVNDVTKPSVSYYLSQPGVVPPDPKQKVLSPAVDAGSDTAAVIGLYRHTTRTDNVLDFGIVDLGYHYLLSTDLTGDFDFDGDVDMADYALFLQDWLREGCVFPDWCMGTDLNRDGRVNMQDQAIFSANYSLIETTAPNPDPMTWEVAPTSFGRGAVAMAATTATDNSSGTDVEYYFQCVFGNCHDRTWDPCSTYTDTGLKDDTKYGYRVRARDTSAALNKTQWSIIGYAVPGADGADLAAPKPDPMTWQVTPYSTGTSSIAMTAKTAVDISGVEYYFESLTFGGHDSGWQAGANYEDTGLSADTAYTYRVKARDRSARLNETDWSVPASATTSDDGGGGPDPGGDDTTAPTPNPPQWAVAPTQTCAGGSSCVHTMTAVAAADETGPVEYYFDSITGNGVDSGWQASPTYQYFVGFDTVCNYRFKVRDGAGNETAWSTTLSTSPF